MDGDPLEIRTTGTRYAPGETVELSLENRSDRDLEYNLCAAMRLDRRTDGGWESVPPDPDRVCTLELRLLAAGESGRGTVDVPEGLAPGTYRFRFEGLQWAGGGGPPPESSVSNGFEVRPGG